MTHDPRLDDYPTLALPDAHPEQRGPSAAVTAGASQAARCADHADMPCPVRQSPNLGDKRFRLGRAAATIPNPSRPDLEVVIVHVKVGDSAGNSASRIRAQLALKNA